MELSPESRENTTFATPDGLFRYKRLLFGVCSASEQYEHEIASALAGTSSETQGQIVGAMESLNGRKNMARRKVKNGEKSPWGQCLTRPVPNGRRHSGF